MELPELILYVIKKDHRGKENAIVREELLSKIRRIVMGSVYQELTDRQLRNIYCQLPIITCDKGIFYPVRKSEIEEFREYLRKKALPLFERWKRVADVHLNGKQMELF